MHTLMEEELLVNDSAALFPVEQEVIKLSLLLGGDGGSDSVEAEVWMVERLETLLKPYQELPQALDKSLPQLVSNLMIGIHTANNSLRTALCSRGLYLLCKIRGRKFIARLLPKQVHYLDAALSLIRSDLAVPNAWESKYFGLVWLSLLVLLPFDLESITEVSRMEIEQCVVSFVLDNNKPTRDPASLCLAKLLTRPDCNKEMLAFLRSDTEDAGLLLAKAAVFKRTNAWHEVAPLALELFPRTLDQCLLHFSGSNVTRKMVYIKLLRRMFTAEQGPRASEDFINFLLSQALGDGDSRVRWQAAKATRRIVECGIPELYGAVLQVFSEGETGDEDLWHGACLAIAEMIRSSRNRSPNIVTMIDARETIAYCITNALGFDRKRGMRTLGSNIRDAGCYVAWALVRTINKRAFAAEDCVALARLLLVTSLFDREVSCRRAASAALQEAVGRLGSIPHGIPLLSLVSYQSVGSSKRSFGAVCDEVCQFAPYKDALMDHLVEVKSRHWDESIRVLAAQAIGRNGNADTLRMLLVRISQTQINQFELHGGLLACAELLLVQGNQAQDAVFQALAHTRRLLQQTFPASLFMLRNAWLRFAQAAVTANEPALAYEEENLMLVEECLKKDVTCQSAAQTLAAILTKYPTLLLLRSKAGDASRWDVNVYGLHACLLASNVTVGANRRAILDKLADCVKSRTNAYTDRVQALIALSEVAGEDVDFAFETCLFGLEDDSHSNQHGDVGSWVRREACISLCALLKRKKKETLVSFAAERCAALACDKLDHVREAGQRALFALLRRGSAESDDAVFHTLEQSFERILDLLLSLPNARLESSLIRGLLLTSGSLNESPSQAAQQVLETWYLAPQTTPASRARVWDVALNLLRKEHGEDVAFIAVCKAMTHLLLNVVPAAQAAHGTTFNEIWLAAVVHVLTSPKRRMAATNTTSSAPSISRQAAVAHVLLGLESTTGAGHYWPAFASILCSAFPSLRKQAAEAFYIWGSGLRDPLSEFGPGFPAAMQFCLQVWLQDAPRSETAAFLQHCKV